MKKFHFNFYPMVLEFVLSRREGILSEKRGLMVAYGMDFYAFQLLKAYLFL